MKAVELMNRLFEWCNDNGEKDYSKTCDTLKCGDPEKEVRKVAVAMTASVDLIREAHRWGADLLIVHEPTFYNHFDEHLEDDPVTTAKEALLKESGMTVWRFHDHPHHKAKDMIGDGMVRSLGLKGTWINVAWAVNRFLLDTPMTAREIAEKCRGLGAGHIRAAGALDFPCKMISLCLGTPGGVFEELRNPDVDIVLTGEISEWVLGEYARDAGQLGLRKALLVLGHIPSEKEGMRLLADEIFCQFPDLEVKYFECGEFCTSLQ
jgi:putative NIF3 family GTP cyclohydrolase 1 type 2